MVVDRSGRSRKLSTTIAGVQVRDEPGRGAGRGGQDQLRPRAVRGGQVAHLLGGQIAGDSVSDR